MSKLKFAGFAAGNQILLEMTVVFNFCIGFRNFELAFFVSRKINDFFGNHAVNNLAVRTFDKTVFVDACIS